MTKIVTLLKNKYVKIVKILPLYLQGEDFLKLE